MEIRSESTRQRLASEPELVAVARGVLRGGAPAPDDEERAAFAKDVRALFGFERLPEPASLWAVKLPSGELALHATLAVGKLDLRRWEGELELFRRPVGDLKAVLAKILERPLGDELARAKSDDGEIVEWAMSGPFERVLAVREGRFVLLRFAPRLDRDIVILAHERPDDVAIERVERRARPPAPWAIPAPLPMPVGGRSKKRLPKAKKRVKR